MLFEKHFVKVCGGGLMPKSSKGLLGVSEAESQLVCPKCGERLRRTHNMQTKQIDATEVRQELWFCPAGHEYWRTEDFGEVGWRYDRSY